jgi:hypothetical protein
VGPYLHCLNRGEYKIGRDAYAMRAAPSK